MLIEHARSWPNLTPENRIIKKNMKMKYAIVSNNCAN